MAEATDKDRAERLAAATPREFAASARRRRAMTGKLPPSTAKAD